MFAMMNAIFFLSSADIYDKVKGEIKQMGLQSQCVGGGRIQHDEFEKKILVYGYSMVS